jgi:hypothetical protein
MDHEQCINMKFCIKLKIVLMKHGYVKISFW